MHNPFRNNTYFATYRLMFSRRWWLTTLLILVAIGITIRLGIWQMSRYHQNNAIANHLAAMQIASPLVLGGLSGPDGLTGMEYRPAQATGTFDFSQQVAIRNQVWLQSWGADMGYHLVAPLVFSDGSAVMVDRGWIPLKYNTPAAWRAFDDSGSVTVTGVIRLPVKPGIGGQADPTLAAGQSMLDFWNTVNLERLQSQIPYRILPVYIQQTPLLENPNLPYQALSFPDMTSANTNAAFATMWFAFTGLLILGYPVYLRKDTTGNSVSKM